MDEIKTCYFSQIITTYERQKGEMRGRAEKTYLQGVLDIICQTEFNREVYELLAEDRVRGVLFHTSSNETSRDYFAYLLLRNYLPPTPTASSVGPTAATITAIFERLLLYDAWDKKEWNRCGRKLFTQKAQYYISLNARIEMALPAFPCKSTNPDKVASQIPDSTEYEALSNLAEFCKEVQAVYSPGCRINLVSDGHVFSDCTGVDDSTVTSYTSKLLEMSQQIFHGPVKGSLRFYNLVDLLLPTTEAHELFRVAVLEEEEDDFPSPILTKVELIDHWCRVMLIRAFAPPKPFIQDLIASVPEHPLTSLYRGFSRFMLDDLAAHPEMMSCKSNSARKKLAESVALVMIRRNQSYSRLVEMVMPRHIRLSIHAHNNAGPKFGVKLLSFKAVPDVGVISEDEAAKAAADHLHIPTPWHASLMEIHRPGKPVETVVCKAQVAREFIGNRGRIGSYYIESHDRGGRFVVKLQES